MPYYTDMDWLRSGESISASPNNPPDRVGNANKNLGRLLDNTEYLRERTDSGSPLLEPVQMTANGAVTPDKSYEVTAAADVQADLSAGTAVGQLIRFRLKSATAPTHIFRINMVGTTCEDETLYEIPCTGFNIVLYWDGNQWRLLKPFDLNMLRVGSTGLGSLLSTLSGAAADFSGADLNNAGSPHTAVAGNAHAIDATGGSVVVNMPSPANNGDIVRYYDPNGTLSATNTLTINGNGNTLIGGAAPYIMKTAGAASYWRFNAGNWGLISTAGDSGGVGEEQMDAFTTTAAQTVFTLTRARADNTVAVMFWNGVAYLEGVDFSIAADNITITWINNGTWASWPAGQTVQVKYFVN